MEDVNKTSVSRAAATRVVDLYTYAAVSLIVLIIVTGTIGNILVILAVKTTKKLQTISNVFVINLSVCDLLFVTMVLPFNIYTYLEDGWFLDQFGCKFVGFLGYTLTGTTLMNVTLIAWNRFKLVTDMSRYSMLFSWMNIAIMLGMTWVVPVLCLLPALLELWGRFGYEAMLVTCNLLLDHDSQSFKLFLLIVRALVPSGLIIYCYGSIYSITHSNHRRLAISTCSATFNAHVHRHEMHMTRMMAVIFVIFAMSYFPCTITGMIDWNTVLSKHFHMYCALAVYLGSAVNPLIYGLMNSQFREAYKDLLCPNKSKLIRKITPKYLRIKKKANKGRTTNEQVAEGAELVSPQTESTDSLNQSPCLLHKNKSDLSLDRGKLLDQMEDSTDPNMNRNFSSFI